MHKLAIKLTYNYSVYIMQKTTNPGVIDVLTQAVARFNAQAKVYFERNDSGLGKLYLEDAEYNKCLTRYMKNGNYTKLIDALIYQDTIPRERVIGAMMAAGCYPEA